MEVGKRTKKEFEAWLDYFHRNQYGGDRDIIYLEGDKIQTFVVDVISKLSPTAKKHILQLEKCKQKEIQDVLTSLLEQIKAVYFHKLPTSIAYAFCHYCCRKWYHAGLLGNYPVSLTVYETYLLQQYNQYLTRINDILEQDASDEESSDPEFEDLVKETTERLLSAGLWSCTIQTVSCVADISFDWLYCIVQDYVLRSEVYQTLLNKHNEVLYQVKETLFYPLCVYPFSFYNQTIAPIEEKLRAFLTSVKEGDRSNEYLEYDKECNDMESELRLLQADVQYLLATPTKAETQSYNMVECPNVTPEVVAIFADSANTDPIVARWKALHELETQTQSHMLRKERKKVLKTCNVIFNQSMKDLDYCIDTFRKGGKEDE